MTSLVGKKAPNFKTNAIINDGTIINIFTIKQLKDEKYVLLLFYTKYFTFVCTTEIHAFQEELTEFLKRYVQIIAASTYTENSPLGWLHIPKNKVVTNPIIAYTNKNISHITMVYWQVNVFIITKIRLLRLDSSG